MSRRSGVRAALGVAAALLVSLVSLAQVTAQSGGISTAMLSSLKWRMVGPFRGGRVNAVTGVPGQPNTFYFGSVGGGLWKSDNAGRTWNPIMDSATSASIGAIAVAPSNPAVVYVGTGEADMRDSIAFGDGMYKSTDAGQTWHKSGLQSSRQIAKILVDPHNPDLVYVAVLGHVYGPSQDRGVYRSKDGGATWQKILFKGDTAGGIDLAFDPSNSKTIYAALWAVRRPPWFIYAPANEPGSGLFKSTDGGDTWNQLTNGLPSVNLGRMGIGISQANPSRVYIIADVTPPEPPAGRGGAAAPDANRGAVDPAGGGLFRSEDGGATFTKISSDSRIWQRGWYFETVTVDPKNPDVLYIPSTGVFKSTDGGKTWGAPIKASPGGDDYHQIWVAPEDSNRLILGGDQGTVVSVDGAKTWSSWYNQPTAQLYHVAADYRFPYWLTAAQQDSGAVATPHEAIHGVISMHEWTGACAGGESGYTAPDPLHPDILYGGTVEKCNVVTGATKNVSPETPQTAGAPQTPIKYRHDWTQPLVFSPADPHALYFGNQFLYKTSDGGEHWTKISDDLTRPNPGVPPNIDAGAAADTDLPNDPRRGVIYTISPSPVRAPLVWIGTDDGVIQVTQDDGKTWTNVTPKEMTSWTKVTMVEASHYDTGTAYASGERHQLEDYDPHIWRTKDGGKSWQPITNGLPLGVYVQTVKEDPGKRGLLFCGTERAVYVSFDDGDHWQPLQLNMPPVSVRDLQIKDGDLLAATHGRGFWSIDDMTPLREMTAPMGEAFLFKMRDTVVTPPGSEFGTPLPKDEPFAENPPYGAAVSYFLKQPAAGGVTIEIVDPSGTVIRRVSSTDPVVERDPNTLAVQPVWQPAPVPPSAAAGFQRWVWDLRPTPAAGGRGRGGRGAAAAGAGAPPAGAAAAGRGAGGRGAAGRGAGAGAQAAGAGGGGGRGALIAAGTYTVRLTVDGKTFSQPLVLKGDPRGGV